VGWLGDRVEYAANKRPTPLPTPQHAENARPKAAPNIGATKINPLPQTGAQCQSPYTPAVNQTKEPNRMPINKGTD